MRALRDTEIVAGMVLVAAICVAAYYYYVTVAAIDSGLQDAMSGGGSQSSSSSGLESSILNALSNFENVGSSHNNPGGICGGYDANGNCTGPATFATLDAGVEAGEALVKKYLVDNPSITVAEFVQKWSGATGQVLQNYVSSVSSALGLSPNDQISNANADGGDDPEAGGSDDDYGT